MSDQNNIVIYQSKDGNVELRVELDQETVWLTQKQMGELFGKDTKTINQHIRHIYEEGELDQISTISKSEIVQKEGARSIAREVKTYNLDVVISVGYRVKSKEGTQFRIWANKVLRDHIIKGYTLNQKRLAENGLKDLEQSLSLIQQTLLNQDLVTDLGKDAKPLKKHALKKDILRSAQACKKLSTLLTELAPLQLTTAYETSTHLAYYHLRTELSRNLKQGAHQK